MSAAAGEEIAAGNLDTRLLITLATLAAQVHRVNVIEVGDSGPGASAGVPLRMVELSTLVVAADTRARTPPISRRSWPS